jgi:hypothetical protein
VEKVASGGFWDETGAGPPMSEDRAILVFSSLLVSLMREDDVMDGWIAV